MVCRARSQKHQGGEEKKTPKIKIKPKNKKPRNFWNYAIFSYFVHPRAAGSLIFERFRTLFVLKYILKLILTNEYALMCKCLCRPEDFTRSVSIWRIQCKWQKIKVTESVEPSRARAQFCKCDFWNHSWENLGSK